MAGAAATLWLMAAAASALQPMPVRTAVARCVHPAMCQPDKAADVRKQVAKARRAAISEGTGGMMPRKNRAKGKRSERKAPPSGKGFGQKQEAARGGLNFDRRPSPSAACLCGSGVSYGDCTCRALHDGAAAATPSDLVRARFTAFAYRLPAFLMRTTDPEGEEYQEDASGWTRSLLGFCDDFEFQARPIQITRDHATSLTPSCADHSS